MNRVQEVLTHSGCVITVGLKFHYNPVNGPHSRLVMEMEAPGLQVTSPQGQSIAAVNQVGEGVLTEDRRL